MILLVSFFFSRLPVERPCKSVELARRSVRSLVSTAMSAVLGPPAVGGCARPAPVYVDPTILTAQEVEERSDVILPTNPLRWCFFCANWHRRTDFSVAQLKASISERYCQRYKSVQQRAAPNVFPATQPTMDRIEEVAELLGIELAKPKNAGLGSKRREQPGRSSRSQDAAVVAAPLQPEDSAQGASDDAGERPEQVGTTALVPKPVNPSARLRFFVGLPHDHIDSQGVRVQGLDVNGPSAADDTRRIELLTRAMQLMTRHIEEERARDSYATFPHFSRTFNRIKAPSPPSLTPLCSSCCSSCCSYSSR